MNVILEVSQSSRARARTNDGEREREKWKNMPLTGKRSGKKCSVDDGKTGKRLSSLGPLVNLKNILMKARDVFPRERVSLPSTINVK